MSVRERLKGEELIHFVLFITNILFSEKICRRKFCDFDQCLPLTFSERNVMKVCKCGQIVESPNFKPREIFPLYDSM